MLGAALTDRETGLFDDDHVRLVVERPAGRILQEIEAFCFESSRDDQVSSRVATAPSGWPNLPP